MQSAGAVERVANVAAATPDTLCITVGGMPRSGLVDRSLSVENAAKRTTISAQSSHPRRGEQRVIVKHTCNNF